MPSIGAIEQLSISRAFGCDIIRFAHKSTVLGGLLTKWHAIVPRLAATPSDAAPALPVLYYLSGLTCTDENFIQKAGAARAAAEHRVAVVAPDTSPRGARAPGEDDGWDFGTGAGFYVDATTPDFSENYRMFSYVASELPQVVKSALGTRVDISRESIFGHSMGGHGALVLALRHPERYRSCSAFAPICHPIMCPWGEKCFGGYLGTSDESRKAWSSYDATELMKARGTSNPLYGGAEILIDQGADDSFLAKKQLLPEDFATACESTGQKVSPADETQTRQARNFLRTCCSNFSLMCHATTFDAVVLFFSRPCGSIQLNLRMHEGYGHDYFFIQTFVDDHIAHHAKFLYA